LGGLLAQFAPASGGCTHTFCSVVPFALTITTCQSMLLWSMMGTKLVLMLSRTFWISSPIEHELSTSQMMSTAGLPAF
jgi:hypothetical protein